MRIPQYRVLVVREGSVRPEEQTAMDNPSIVASAMQELSGFDEREYWVVFFLDGRNRVKGFSIVSIGTLSASLVHPRETFRAAIVHGAAGVICAHSHPSGDCSPSQEDKETTNRLRRAGELLGLPLLDHVIWAAGVPGNYFSFRAHGLL